MVLARPASSADTGGMELQGVPFAWHGKGIRVHATAWHCMQMPYALVPPKLTVPAVLKCSIRNRLIAVVSSNRLQQQATNSKNKANSSTYNSIYAAL